MTIDLKTLVVRVNDEVFNKRNLEILDEVFSPDYIINDTEKIHMNQGDLKKRLRGMFSSVPDLHVSVEPLLQEGEMVAWVRTHTGTPVNEGIGIPVTGKKMKWVSCYISRVVDGKVCEEWHSVNPYEVKS